MRRLSAPLKNTFQVSIINSNVTCTERFRNPGTGKDVIRSKG